MLLPSKFSLEQCKDIDNFIKQNLSSLHINFFGYTKSYPNNRRFTLSNDPEFLRLYFELKHYELEWVGYPKALKEYGNQVGTWQFCHENHQCCRIWQEHKKIRNTGIYLWMYFTYKNYTTFFIFGMDKEFVHILSEGVDREITLLLNNPNLLRRFIQSFKSHFSKMLKQVEKHKYHVLNINKEVIGKEYKQYWGEYVDSISEFKKQNLPEKIYLTGKYHEIFLTRDEAILLYKYYHGEKYREIAKYFGVSLRTIDARVSQIKIKLNARTKYDLIQILVEHEILEVIQFSI